MFNDRQRYVYIFGALNKPLKIGVTTDVTARLDGVQTGCYFPLECLHQQTVDDAWQVERLIHKNLSRFRLSGEWFSLALDEAKAAVQAAIQESIEVQASIERERLNAVAKRRESREKIDQHMSRQQDDEKNAEIYRLARNSFARSEPANLRKWLEQKAILIEQFAQMLGVSDNTVRRYISGQRVPKLDIMLRIRELTDRNIMPNDFYS